MNAFTDHLRTLFVALVTGAALSACLVTTPNQRTPSGKPEVTLPGNVGRAALARVMTEVAAGTTYSCKSRTHNQVVFERVVDDASSSVQYVFDLTFRAFEGEGRTRVIGAAQSQVVRGGVPQPKTDSGRSVDSSVQAILNKVEAALNQGGAANMNVSEPQCGASGAPRVASASPAAQQFATSTASSGHTGTIEQIALAFLQADRTLMRCAPPNMNCKGYKAIASQHKRLTAADQANGITDKAVVTFEYVFQQTNFGQVGPWQNAASAVCIQRNNSGWRLGQIHHGTTEHPSRISC
jgi:hypothetical protein